MTEDSFAPVEEDLREIRTTLLALQNPAQYDHANALMTLSAKVSSPPYILSVLHVFSRGDMYKANDMDFPINLRCLAGFVLKNYVFCGHTIQIFEALRSYIKSELLVALHDPHDDISRTSAMMIAKIASSFIFPYWSDLYASLISNITGEGCSYEATRGSLLAMEGVVEDCPEKLCMEDTVVCATLRTFLLYCVHSIENLQISSIRGYNSLLYHINSEKDSSESSEVHVLMVDYVDRLLSLLKSGDTKNKVCTEAVRGLTILCTYHAATVGLERLYCALEVCTFIIVHNVDADTIMECCEFFIVILERSTLIDTKADLLAPFIAHLIPALISRMIYTEEHLQEERLTRQDGFNEVQGEGLLSSHHNIFLLHRSEDESSVPIFTLRQQAASTMDLIASKLGVKILEYALPAIENAMNSGNIWVIESGLLALGAISDGCSEGMIDYMPSLFPVLKGYLSHEIVEIRSVTCWVIGKYVEQYCILVNKASIDNTMESLLVTLAATMLDPDPKVQESACLAFSTIVSNPDPQISIMMEPFLSILLQHIEKAGEVYGDKNSLVLCDTIAIVATNFGNSVNSEYFTNICLPFLIRKFHEYDVMDPLLINILETFTSVAHVCKLDVKRVIVPLFHRVAQITTLAITRLQNTESESSDDPSYINDSTKPLSTDEEFVVCCMNVFEILYASVGTQIDAFLIEVPYNVFLDILRYCLSIGNHEISTVTLGTVGTLCELSYQHFMAPILPLTVSSTLNNFQMDHPQLLQNASWLVGVIVTRTPNPGELSPTIPEFKAQLISALHAIECPNDTGMDLFETSIVDMKSNKTYSHCSTSHIFRLLYNTSPPSIEIRSTIVTSIGKLLTIFDHLFNDITMKTVVTLCRTFSLICDGNEKQLAMKGLMKLLSSNISMVLASRSTMEAIFFCIFACVINGFENFGVDDYSIMYDTNAYVLPFSISSVNQDLFQPMRFILLQIKNSQIHEWSSLMKVASEIIGINSTQLMEHFLRSFQLES